MTVSWLQRLYYSRNMVSFVHDMIVAALSLWLALYLRVGSLVFDPPYVHLLQYGVPIFTGIAVGTYSVFGMYRGVWRYASVPDLITIVKANILAVLIFVPFLFFVTRLETMPRTVPVIQLLVLIMCLGGSRLTYRALRSNRLLLATAEGLSTIPVLIYGYGDEAEQFIRASRNRKVYETVGILDDNANRQGKTIHGVKVLGGVAQLDAVLRQFAKKSRPVQKIIIADKSVIEINGTPIRELMDSASKFGLTTVRLPKMTEMREIDSGTAIPLQPINIEDLLGRPQIVMNSDAIRAMLTGRRVLITGAGGSIGAEIVQQVAAFAPEALCLLDNSEHNLYQVEMKLREDDVTLPVDALIADVRDPSRLGHIFNRFRPHVVFHAAAYKHVPMVEHNPAEGVLTNVIGTRNVALAAQRANVAAMVQISTDKAVNPTNVMGATKKLAEMLCQALDNGDTHTTRFMTVRFGNVLGSSGSVVPLFKRQLERGGPLTVTDARIERFFMTIPEAVGLVLSASAYGLETVNRGQIFVLNMGKAIRIDDLARQMIRLAGLRPGHDIRIEYTGLRPGEKLYEELFNAGEAPTETSLPNIQSATPATQSLATLTAVIDRLERAARDDDTALVKQLLAEIVPNYGAAPTVAP